MRPLARSYLQHGSRHGSTGSDPIPGIGQIQFAALKNFSAITVAGDNAIHYLSMEDGVTGFFETSDDTVFANAQNTFQTGNPWSIKCLANGTYIVKQNYFVRSGTAGAQVTTYHTFNGGNTQSVFQAGRTAALIGDTWDVGSSDVHTFFEEWVDATDGSPAPVFVSPYVQLASGSNVTVNAETMVIYLGPYAGGNI